jgi:drug/metabolite transporter superfamily protein YnfA
MSSANRVRRWVWAEMPALLVAAAAILLSAFPAVAAGRVYGSDHAVVCRKMADIPGVYAVWCWRPEDTSSLRFEVVVRPGVHWSSIAESVRSVLAINEHETMFSDITAGIWTYRDPSICSAFTETMADLIPGPLGFPDYRGQEIGTVSTHLQAPPTSALLDWRITRAAPGPNSSPSQ